jgi:hypothetical protein
MLEQHQRTLYSAIIIGEGRPATRQGFVSYVKGQ